MRPPHQSMRPPPPRRFIVLPCPQHPPPTHPPRRRFIVIPCRQPSPRTRQLPAKRSPIRSRPKPDHGIHRQCRQPLVEFLRPPQQRLHLAHNPCRQLNQIACRQSVHTTTRVRRHSPQHPRL